MFLKIGIIHALNSKRVLLLIVKLKFPPSIVTNPKLTPKNLKVSVSVIFSSNLIVISYAPVFWYLQASLKAVCKFS
ncbi:hypothetical protein OIBDGNHJ_00001 [Campylobacter phage PC22]|nr:hypothetical protein OIBDGNHJ_00001 [Campylobacter phage PC22]